MPELKIGQKAPLFTLPADDGKDYSLADYKGRKLVLYFYPKDDTPGCTKESCDFRDSLKGFEKLGVTIFGLSKDKVSSHQKFKKKFDLNFPLLSDAENTVCEQYGVWVEKSMYGKKYFGIERSTFLIDEQGKIAQIWRKVSVEGHVAEVQKAIKSLAKAA